MSRASRVLLTRLTPRNLQTILVAFHLPIHARGIPPTLSPVLIAWWGAREPPRITWPPQQAQMVLASFRGLVALTSARLPNTSSTQELLPGKTRAVSSQVSAPPPRLIRPTFSLETTILHGSTWGILWLRRFATSLQAPTTSPAPT